MQEPLLASTSTTAATVFLLVAEVVNIVLTAVAVCRHVRLDEIQLPGAGAGAGPRPSLTTSTTGDPGDDGVVAKGVPARFLVTHFWCFCFFRSFQ